MIYNVFKLRNKWIDYVDADFPTPQIPEICALLDKCEDVIKEKISDGEIVLQTVKNIYLLSLPILFGHMVNDISSEPKVIQEGITKLQNEDHKIDVEILFDIAEKMKREVSMDSLFTSNYSPSIGEVEVELAIRSALHYIINGGEV